MVILMDATQAIDSPIAATQPPNQNVHEAICESHSTVETIEKPVQTRHITSSNAAELGRLSGEARNRRAQARRNRASELQTIAETPVHSPNFQQERLSRVRAQLTKIDAMMASETDPSKLDRLASAQARLSEQERILDGRPLPGSHRPSKPRPTGKAGSIAPEE